MHIYEKAADHLQEAVDWVSQAETLYGNKEGSTTNLQELLEMLNGEDHFFDMLIQTMADRGYKFELEGSFEIMEGGVPILDDDGRYWYDGTCYLGRVKVQLKETSVFKIMRNNL